MHYLMFPKLGWFHSTPAPLLTMMGSKSSEVVYTCLQHAQVLLARQPQLWTDSYQTFYCRLV